MSGSVTAIVGSLVASLAIQVCGVLTGIITARVLGPVGKGELTAVLLWPALLQGLVALGVMPATTYFAAKKSAGIFGTTLFTSLGQASLLAALGFCLAPVVLGSYGREVVLAGQVCAVSMGVATVAENQMALLNGHMRFRAYNGLRFMVTACATLGVLVLAAAGLLTVLHVVLAWLLANGATLLAALWLQPARRINFQTELFRQLLGYAARVYPGNLSSLLNNRLDQLIISIALAPADLGLYAVAVTLAAGVGLVGSAFVSVALPAVSRAGSLDEQREVAGRLSRLAATSSALSALALVGLLPLLIALFFGPDFLPATDAARILVVGSFFFNMSLVLAAILRGLDRPFDASKGDMASLVLTVIGLVALLGPLGILGAALVSLVAYAANCAWLTWAGSRALGFSPVSLWLPAAADLAFVAGRIKLAARSGAARPGQATPARGDQ